MKSKPFKNTLYPLYLLAALFIIPFVSASILYAKRDKLSIPLKSPGTLFLEPPLLNEAELKEITRFPMNAHFERKWQLLYIMPAACHTSCQQRQHLLPNLRVALGKNTERLIVRFVTSPTLISGDTYLVSPFGKVLVHYAPSVPEKAILKEITRLMRYSYEG